MIITEQKGKERIMGNQAAVPLAPYALNEAEKALQATKSDPTNIKSVVVPEAQ